MKMQPFPHYKVKKGDKEYVYEKIFTEKEPRSRVILDTVKNIENKLDKLSEIKSEYYLKLAGVEQYEGDYCLVLEMKEPAQILAKYLKRKEITLRKKLSWTLDLIKLVEEAEAEGRNWPVIPLKSLRVDKNETLKLLDPELVESIAQYRQDMHQFIPSANYTAPEILEGGEVSQQTRIYNIGVLLYYLLTGEPPFGRDSKTKIYDRSITGSFIEPCILNHEISGEVNELVKDMLAVEPEDRLQTWEQVRGRLEAILSQNLLTTGLSEQQARQQKRDKVISRHQMKEKIHFTFRHHWKTIVFGIAAVIGIFYIFFSGQGPTYVTEETKPRQVVNYFYDSITEKNVIKIGETTTVNLGNLQTMLSESYVMKKMEQAYGKFSADNTQSQSQQSSSNTEPESAPKKKEEAKKELFGIENLQIKQISSEPQLVYQVNYNMYFNREDKSENFEMEDRVALSQRHNRWQIVEIKGDIIGVIKGNFQSQNQSGKGG